MVLEKKTNAEPIPGYRLIELLGSGGFGEVWKCEAPGGIFKAIKFVYGNINGLSSISRRAENELKAVQHIKSIRHPFLLSIDRLELIDGELVIVTELADQNLHQVLQKYQAEGLPGIPRDELLGYLLEAAEVLDMLNVQCHLQHLDVKPGNLFLVGNHIKVADFGLVQSLTLNQPAGQLGAITPLYAAPELFMGTLSRHCDQYSLAIVFQELLTGTIPFDGKNSRLLLLQHTKQEPDLRALSTEDQHIVAKAMHKNFNHRFESCEEFVRALCDVKRPGGQGGAQVEAPQSNLGDTHIPSGPQTVKIGPGSASPSVPPGILSAMRFIECVVNSPLVETWKVQPRDSKPELVHFIYGCTLSDSGKLQELGMRLSSLQHPGLLPAHVVHTEPGRLILVTPAVAETLRDRCLQCHKLKQAGIMRGELVDYIRAAAEILDYLYQQHSVQHLGLNPRNIMLDKGWLQLAEFGLAQLVWLPSGQDVAQRNVRYAAPELLQKQVARSTDQFSLALIYAEMLTGVHPFQGQDPRNRRAPDLDKLPAIDRDVIARALSTDPAQRWPSATEMALALEGTAPEKVQQLEHEHEDSFVKMLKKPRRSSAGLPSMLKICEDMHAKIADLVVSIGGKVEGIIGESAPVLCEEAQVLEHRFQVCSPLGSARQHIEPFFAELGGQPVRQEEACYEMTLPLPGTLWQRVRGKLPSVNVRIELARVHIMSATPVEFMVHIATRNLDREKALEILEKNGPAILERLRTHVLVGSEKRMHDRLLWPDPLRLVPVAVDGELEDPIDCRGKDISLSGMGLYLPHELDTREVILHIPNSVHAPMLEVPATLVRAHRCADGWYDVGALFHLPALKRSMPEINIS